MLRRSLSSEAAESLITALTRPPSDNGRLAPSYYTQDGVVPRTKIPETLKVIAKISDKYGLRIANIFHAGDGNMHPAILFDLRDPAQLEKTIQAGAEILAYCVSVGGTITGEHGVGMEKDKLMSLLFTSSDMDVMKSLREAFNPNSLFNPGKIFPTTRSCRETGVAAIPPDLRYAKGPDLSGKGRSGAPSPELRK